MGYCPLTDAEIANRAQAYRDYALKLYGDVAHTIKTATDADYNGEPCDDYVGYVKVYDASGTALDYDFNLPFWQEEIAARRAYLSRPEVYESYKEQGWALDWDEVDVYCMEYALRSQLPPLQNDGTEFTFLVHEPPVR